MRIEVLSDFQEDASVAFSLDDIALIPAAVDCPAIPPAITSVV